MVDQGDISHPTEEVVDERVQRIRDVENVGEGELVDVVNTILDRHFFTPDEIPDREGYTKTRQEAVERIRKRTPEDMEANFRRATDAINKMYAAKQMSSG